MRELTILSLFFQNGTSYPISVVTTKEVVEFENYNEPLQGRLSFTTRQDEMRLMWSTLSSTKPQVKWGEESGKYLWIADADTVTYGVHDLCGEPATSWGWREPGLLHTVIMNNLQKGKKYFYIYGDDEFGWSEENSFFPFLGADPTRKARFYAYGDMGQAPEDGSIDPKFYQPNARIVTKTILEDFAAHKNETNFVLHIGDISYAVGYAAEWDEFGEEISPIAQQIAYQASPGNHESDWPGTDAIFVGSDSGGECGLPFYLRFPIPEMTVPKLKKASEPGTHWYSFDSGAIHVVMMSTEHDFSYGSAQYNFIQKDFASVDRQLTPWILLTGHRPMYIDSTAYSVNASDNYVAGLLRQYIEPLMIKYQVDVGFWGHHHSYQRSCFVDNTTCRASPTTTKSGNTTTSVFRSDTYYAPVHFVIGMAGATFCTNIQPTPPIYMEYVNDYEYGFALIEAEQTSFHLSFITEYGDLRDELYIYKDY
eukprot:TRINITY_DN2796_c0_g5_i2.p1 TRINITY_DN2796_c0_g5~~TRINITY_DN2796_c0_g5_i2.p1  ORF type:complete len:480 (-),score=100.71 TRINITY_DN2796_c0_g5_i2:193-1632(-)